MCFWNRMLFTTPLFIVDEEMGKKVHFGPIKTVFVATFFKFLTRNFAKYGFFGKIKTII